MSQEAIAEGEFTEKKMPDEVREELHEKQKRLFLEKGIDTGLSPQQKQQWLEEARKEKNARSLTDMLNEFTPWAEGKRQFAYEDSVGKLTIGIGRNLSDRGLSDEEIQYLFDRDRDAAIKEAESFPWFGGLNTVRKMVIADMIFNMGLPRFSSFVRTIAAIEARDYEAAARQMMDSKWFRQTGRRAQRLVSMMATGEWA